MLRRLGRLAPSFPPVDRRGRVAGGGSARGGGSAVAPPAAPGRRSLLPEPLPARYLRTLAHDPGGYDPTALGRRRSICCWAICCFIRRTSWAPRRAALGLSCHVCHPNGATNATLTIEGVSDRPGNVDLTTAHFRAGADNRIADPINTPSLRGVRFTSPYGRDGRTASLSEFVRDVVTSEFGGRAAAAGAAVGARPLRAGSRLPPQRQPRRARAAVGARERERARAARSCSRRRGPASTAAAARRATSARRSFATARCTG